MKLQVVQEEKFSCSCCGECCRKWLVEITEDEAAAVQKLPWPAGDPLVGVEAVLRHGGKLYLRHRVDGCVFLNQSNNRCRIHEQFGEQAKPLGCSVYPFQFRPTFDEEASISSRFDCPTVRQNIGRTHQEQLPTLRQYADEMHLRSDGFSETMSCNLDREQIQAVSEFVATMINGFADDRQKDLFIYVLCDWLATTQVDELDRVSLGASFGQIKSAVESIAAGPVKRPNFFARLAFRALLGLYLRRDEDVLMGRANRVKRMLALIKIIFGLGGFRGLGVLHRVGKLSKAKLFKPGIQSNQADLFGLHWRMIRNKLETFQFMGKGNNDRNFLDGLRSLSLLYPLVLAVAKYSAGNRGSSVIEGDDVSYAVGEIEHSVGRLAILNTPMTKSLEMLLLDPKVFVRLISTV